MKVWVIAVIFLFFVSLGSACQDSDSGINYHVEGKTTYQGEFGGKIQEISAPDFCFESYVDGKPYKQVELSDYLWESYCENNVSKRIDYKCPEGCLNGACIGNDINDTTGCVSLYYIDNSNKNCEQKDFCGMYMYRGLQTFEDRTECQNALEKISSNLTDNETENYCHFYYWFDDENKECGQKEYCQSFMYRGLQIFENKNDCIAAANVEKKKCPMGSEFQENGTICYYSFSNGRKAEVKIMPETASDRAIERGELNFTVELEEVGFGNEERVVYELKGEKKGKFLGIFKIMARIRTQVDAQTGEVIRTEKPWWSFLASGV